jgi:Zn-dependent metalloprotease
MDKSGYSPAAIRFKAGNRPTASSFFEEYRQFFLLPGDNQLRLWNTLSDQLGQTHYRFNQYYKGIQVLGGQYILHETGGYIAYANGYLVHGLDIDVTPALSEQVALSAALKAIGAEAYMWENDANETFIKREQDNPNTTFYPKGELKITAGWEELLSENCKLVYRFDVYAEKPLGRYWVDVDAVSGEVVNKISRIHDTDVPGSGASLYNGTVNMIVDQLSPSSFRLQENTTRGAAVRTYNMNNGTNYNTATNFTAASAAGPWDAGGVSGHFGAEVTYDYYFNDHGRNSLDNAGMALLSYVHYGVNYVNAFWDGSRMTYGDGNGTSFTPLISLDVVSHELTHGVTEFSANLVYQKESGALNESFSDIFGNLVEFEVEGVPGVGTGNWRVGEDITTSGLGIRNMMNPNEFGDPDTYGGTNWVNQVGCVPGQGNDWCGVHTNSGVQNFWFYLLVEGGSGTNDNGDPYNVTGLGAADAAAIAYRNLTVYLSSGSDYLNARYGSVDAAADLFGAASSQVQAVKDAWDAVGVYEPVPPEGILVWEGQSGGQDYSGAYINNYLTNAGFITQYTVVFPPTLIGYDAVFLSFGNYGSGGGTNTVFSNTMAAAVQDYLQAGGKVYLEGGDALGWDQRLNAALHSLFGLSAVSDGSTNVINGLQGQTGALTDGMAFTSSTQLRNAYIDLFTSGSGTVSFIESGYGNVAVENTGASGQKTVCFSYALAELSDGTSPATRDDLLAAILSFLQISPPRVSVNTKVFLEGAFNAGGSDMTTVLANNNWLPLNQPFNAAPWNYSGSESVTAIPAGVVDWVLLELRSGTTAGSMIAMRAAFLKNDGSIVDLDGATPVYFPGVSDGNYHIVVRHRNHLSVMSASPLSLSESSSLYDFTTAQSQAYGTNAMKEISTGVYGMFAGDGNSDGSVSTTDREDVWNPQNGTTWEYTKSGDYNLDGGIDATDLNMFWRPNEGRGSGVPGVVEMFNQSIHPSIQYSR